MRSLECYRSYSFGVSIFWRIFLLYAFALLTVTLVLLISPVTISTTTTPSEAVVVIVGFAALLLVGAAAAGEVLRGVTTLRDALASSAEEAVTLPAGSPPELVQVAEAHNQLAARLEAERTSTARASMRAQEEERSRLAADLHDEVGQNLTFMLLRLTAIARNAPDPIKAEVDALADTARLALDEVRSLSRQLRPAVLEDLGLQPALLSLIDDVRDLGLDAYLDFPAWVEPDAERDLVAYRVVQEALTNVVKHAEASTVAVSVHREDDRLDITVTDDGLSLIHI